MSAPPEYRPFDQPKHLGDPPWSGPAVEAWEEAHGHDCRLDCYPEYQCQAIAAERDWLTDELAAARDEVADWKEKHTAAHREWKQLFAENRELTADLDAAHQHLAEGATMMEALLADRERLADAIERHRDDALEWQSHPDGERTLHADYADERLWAALEDVRGDA